MEEIGALMDNEGTRGRVAILFREKVIENG